MPSLKDLKVRINSVKSTQKITSAMKMVAAAKLRRAQEQAESARPYADRMARLPGSLAGAGDARPLTRELLADRKDVKILCIGRKGRDQLKRDFGARIVGTVEDIGKPRLTFAAAEGIQKRLLTMFEAGEFDIATVIYSRFKSAISQIVTRQRLIPLPAPAAERESPGRAQGVRATYEYEPSEEELLADLLRRNLAVQLFRALLESWASEQGARMTAMDSATRNAGDMIDRLTLFYNRTRQAYITKELIEIISGAEAL